MISSNDLFNGVTVEVDRQVYTVTWFQHVKPGKGSAFVRTRIKSMLTGRTLEPTFKSGDKVGRPDMEEKTMQFLYKETDQFHFMDTKTYDQTHLTEEQLGDARKFLRENTDVQVLYYQGKPIAVTLPNAITLKITKCDPGVRGDTVSGATKPATLETGHVIQVPLFINEGDTVKVDTRTGQYLTRV